MLLRTVRVHAVRAFRGPTSVYSTSGAGMDSSLCLAVNNLFLLLIFIQFCIFSPVFISPSDSCLHTSHGVLFCGQWYSSPVHDAESAISVNIPQIVFILGLCIPVLLVAFAWLSITLAIYAKDRGALWCSLVCQAFSNLFFFISIFAFGLYMDWKYVPLRFYIFVGLQIQLVVAAVLTRVSERRLPSDWE